MNTFPQHKRWLSALRIFAIWTIVAIFFIVQNHIQAIASDRPFPLVGYSIHQFSNFWLWALFTPLLFKLKMFIDEPDKNVLTYLSAGIIGFGISMVHSFAYNYTSLSLRNILLEQERLDQYLTMAGFIPIGLSNTLSSLLTLVISMAVLFAWSLQKRSKEQETINARLEATLNQTRLEVLKGQLQPHFLFNTLNSISSLTEINPKLSREMISKLSSLLRYSLDHRNRQFTSLKDELEITRKYLEIEKIRFGDRLEFNFEIQEEIRDAKIPFLLLQPLVENSIIHGISRYRKSGEIDIQCSQTGDDIEIVISDNGEAPQEINEELFNKGFGLSITRKRLREMYGPDHHLNLDRNGKEGLKVTIRLPYTRFVESAIYTDEPIDVIE